MAEPTGAGLPRCVPGIMDACGQLVQRFLLQLFKALNRGEVRSQRCKSGMVGQLILKNLCKLFLMGLKQHMNLAQQRDIGCTDIKES